MQSRWRAHDTQSPHGRMQSVSLDLSRVPPHVAAVAMTVAGSARAEAAAASVPLTVAAPASVLLARLIGVRVVLLLQLERRHGAAVAAARPAPRRRHAPGRLFGAAQDRRPLGVRILGEESAQFFADVVLHFLINENSLRNAHSMVSTKVCFRICF